jgi:hypothetical protein
MEASKNVPLHEVLTKYGVPDPKIVGKLPKGGAQLDFVGHADTQKALTEIDPTWSMEPVTFDEYGLPAFRVENGMAHMAAWMTLLGVRRLGVGSVQASKPDLYKELLSDCLRNCALRHNVYLSLWSKSEWEDIPSKNAPVQPKVAPVTADTPLQKTQINQFTKACEKANIHAEDVATRANVVLAKATHGDLEKLRATYKEMLAEKPKEA